MGENGPNKADYARLAKWAEEEIRKEGPGKPLPPLRLWHVRFRELYDSRYALPRWPSPISLMFPGPYSIDYPLAVVRARFGTRRPLDIASVTTVTKTEYVRWLQPKYGLGMAPKKYAEVQIREMRRLVDAHFGSRDKPPSAKEILKLVKGNKSPVLPPDKPNGT